MSNKFFNSSCPHFLLAQGMVQLFTPSLHEPDTSLVVYLSLSSGPRVPFVPRPTWPSDYVRFSHNLSRPINASWQGAEYAVLRTFTPLWPSNVLDIVGRDETRKCPSMRLTSMTRGL